MRRIALLSCAIVALACAKTADQSADTAAAPGAVATTGALSLADVAGKWNFESRAEGTDSVLVRYVLNAAADPAGWTLELPGRAPLAMTVQVSGDSIMMSSPTYESVLRPGVQVSTTSVMRVQDGRLVGRTVARYAAGGADSVKNLSTLGTRAN